MKTHYLAVGAALLSTVAQTATIPERARHSSKLSPVELIPSQAEERPISWAERLKEGFTERFLGKSSRHGQREHELRKQQEFGASLLSKYDGEIVLRFNISNEEEGKAMVEASQVLFLDVWSSTSQHVDIRMSEDVLPSFLGLLPKSLQHAHTRLVPDLGRAAQDTFPGSRRMFANQLTEDAETQAPSSGVDNIFFQDYQPLSVIVPWMQLLESLFPAYAQTVNIGKSYEGRDIYGLRVGIKNPDGKKKRAIIVTGAAHAREWISVSTVSYVAYEFATRKDKEITSLLEAFDWVFIPTLNVDGYAYTWEHDRLWKKNRQPTSLSFCKGIDLDRSYSAHWEAPNSNTSPCSDNYPGQEAFEAVETKRLADWVTSMKEKNELDFVGYLDFHSYSQQILYPYAYSCDATPPDIENLEELAIGLAKAIRLRSGEHYKVSSACNGGGFFTQTETGGGGSAIDYFYSKNVPFAYQIKLRDTGSYGFLLPRENILPTGEESLSVLKYFGQFLGSGSIASEVQKDPLEDMAELELK